MDGWSDVGELDALVEGKAIRVVVDGEPIVLLRAAEDLFAIGGRCTHQAALLDRGVVRIVGSVGTVTCPAHGSVFNLKDGRVMRGPATRPVSAYVVKVEDGRVWVRGRD